MGRKNEWAENVISMGSFIENFILPYLGTSLDDDKLMILNNDLSHLDLDELALPGVKRIGDKDITKYTPGEVIGVRAKGYLHKGYETHYYLRPFSLMYKNNNILLDNTEVNYSYTCEDYVKEDDGLTGEERYRLKKQKREERRKKR